MSSVNIHLEFNVLHNGWYTSVCTGFVIWGRQTEAFSATAAHRNLFTARSNSQTSLMSIIMAHSVIVKQVFSICGAVSFNVVSSCPNIIETYNPPQRRVNRRRPRKALPLPVDQVRVIPHVNQEQVVDPDVLQKRETRKERFGGASYRKVDELNRSVELTAPRKVGPNTSRNPGRIFLPEYNIVGTPDDISVYLVNQGVPQENIQVVQNPILQDRKRLDNELQQYMFQDEKYRTEFLDAELDEYMGQRSREVVVD